MTQKKKTVYEDNDVRVEFIHNNGVARPARYAVTFVEGDEYFFVSPEEMFKLTDALATVCNDLEDRGLTTHAGPRVD